VTNTHPSAASFAQGFFAPLRQALGGAVQHRLCPELTDEAWLHLGVRRALEDRPSGRAFLQHLAASGIKAPDCSHFFETLKSARRLALVAEVSHGLATNLPVLDAPLWKSLPELEAFEIDAGDGHFHAAAAHDRRDSEDGLKYAVGHFFSLHLRSHALAHLALADQLERKKEHDMRALKRTSLEALRQGAASGRKVLYVWDRAGIDFRQWHRWKQSGAVYSLEPGEGKHGARSHRAEGLGARRSAQPGRAGR